MRHALKEKGKQKNTDPGKNDFEKTALRPEGYRCFLENVDIKKEKKEWIYNVFWKKGKTERIIISSSLCNNKGKGEDCCLRPTLALRGSEDLLRMIYSDKDKRGIIPDVDNIDLERLLLLFF